MQQREIIDVSLDYVCNWVFVLTQQKEIVYVAKQKQQDQGMKHEGREMKHEKPSQVTGMNIRMSFHNTPEI